MKNIAITSQDFLTWNGGVDFLRNIIQGLLANNENRYLLLIPQKELPRKNIAYKAARLIMRNIPFYFKRDVQAESLFSEFTGHIKVVHYRRNSLKRVLEKFEVDVLLPCAVPPLGMKQCSWVGYLPDCQHKYLSHLFMPAEITRRDKTFQKMVDTNEVILVNSVDAKNDLIKFYGANSERIHNLPFCPTVDLSWLVDKKNLLSQYSLPSKFFMISNQFWKHKDHLTAFKALSLLKHEGIHIVCSGKMDDNRDSKYIRRLLQEVEQLGLSSRVHFLGFIPKIDQVQIMKHSLAIVQPTMFEGGPGGGCVYDAIAVGVPCILSDIAINREVVGRNTLYFEAQNPNDLAAVLDQFLLNETGRPSNAELHESHLKNLSMRANSLTKLVSKVANENH